VKYFILYEGIKMKIKSVLFASGLLLLSLSVFADPHFDEAIKHASAAVEHGKAGHASVLVEHATPALEHTLAGALNAKGLPKSHADMAVTDLEEAIKHGKENHADIATTYAEAALGHLKEANK
jgi:Small metal-binding protein